MRKIINKRDYPLNKILKNSYRYIFSNDATLQSLAMIEVNKRRNISQNSRHTLPVQINVSVTISSWPKPIFSHGAPVILPRHNLDDDRRPTDLPGKFLVPKLMRSTPETAFSASRFEKCARLEISDRLIARIYCSSRVFAKLTLSSWKIKIKKRELDRNLV